MLFNLFEDYLRDPSALNDYLKSRIPDKRAQYYVLLDEIQYAIGREELRGSEPPRVYGVLNGLLRMRNVDVYVTGSNSKLLSSDVMTEFRGRGDEVHGAAPLLRRVHAGLRGRRVPGLGRVRRVRRDAPHAVHAHRRAEVALP